VDVRIVPLKPVFRTADVNLMMQTGDRKAAALSAAAIYTGATLLNLGEGLLPGGQELSLAPGLASLAVTVFLVLAGPRLRSGGLFAFGLIGAALIGVAIATTRSYGDGAVLYMWPAIWTAYFFPARGAALMVAWIGVVHGVALVALPDVQASVDRWFDVVFAVTVVTAVVGRLSYDRDRLVAGLKAEARSDALTGLLNRRGFEERLAIERDRAHRDGTWLGVATFDVDHFKVINDRHGHEAGDRVLSWLGRVLADQSRGIDIAARIGGEEFVVVLAGADERATLVFAERVRRLVAEAGTRSGREAHGVPAGIDVTVSAGVAGAAGAVDVQWLLEQSDRAMYQAKGEGRDRVVLAGREPLGSAAGQLAQRR
jgi:diguanylate cyclase (GGDEF)-like protein